MKSKLFTLLFLLIIGPVLFLPNSFAQGTASNNMVRLVYFVPRNRQAQPDIDTKLDRLIRDVQALFSDEMERHGFGRKTFVFETDRRGDAVIHRVNGRFLDAYYHHRTAHKVGEEVSHRFDFSKNIYLMVVDISSEYIDGACGKGGDTWNTAGDWGGRAFVPASGHCLDTYFGIELTAHELGHAFSVFHDFSNDAYIMSYGERRTELAQCTAEWLDINRYFNSRRTPASNSPSTIKMLPPLLSPPDAIRFRFEVSDSDGLQCAQLLTPATSVYEAPGEPKLLGCKKIEGKSQTVEFVTTELTSTSKSVTFRIVDGVGNYDWEYYPLDINALLPSARVVSIPDVNLASAIRETLGLRRFSNITQLDMLKLTGLSANQQQITNLTGLEHAGNLKYLSLERNQIRNIAVLEKLTNLSRLSLFSNQIRDFTPIAALTKLIELKLSGNPSNDISPVAALTQLQRLELRGYGIQDLMPFTGLTNLIHLRLEHNQIRDLTPLAGMTQLRELRLWDNEIQDLSPLAGLTHLEWLGLSNNQISDLTPLENLTQLRVLQVANNHKISDLSPLAKIKNLIHLVILSNAVSDLSPLMALTDLETLIASYNQITDISPLVRLKQLTILWLSHNQVSNFKPLTRLFNLTELRVAQNPIADRTSLQVLLDRNSKLDLDIDPSELLPVVVFKGPELPPIYWTDMETSGFYRLIGAKETVENAAVGIQNVVALAIDPMGKVYWTEQESHKRGNIGCANLNGLNPDVIKRLFSVPRDITINVADGKIYATNANGRIQRFNADGSNFEANFITGLDEPKHIASDVAEGKLYWTEKGERIRRANLDGSNIETLVTGLGTLGGIAVAVDKLYWTEQTGTNTGKIQCANLDGTSIETLTSLRSVPLGIAVDADDRKLYWSNAEGKILRANLNGKNVQPLIVGLGNPTDLVLGITSTNVTVRDRSGIDAQGWIVGPWLWMIAPTPAGRVGAASTNVDSLALASNRTVTEARIARNGASEGDRVGNRKWTLARIRNEGISNLFGISEEVDNVTDVVNRIGWAEGDVNHHSSYALITLESATAQRNVTMYVGSDDSIKVWLNGRIVHRDPINRGGGGFQDSFQVNLKKGDNLLLVKVNETTGNWSMFVGVDADVRAVYKEPVPAAPSLLNQLVVDINPENTTLLANYPNPFNPETWIPYHLAEPADVTLQIYATDGVLVRTLALGHQSAGIYQRQSRAAYWNGRNDLGEPVASGVYFYTLSADDFTATRKMLIVK